MKQLFDYLPVVVFFGLYFLGGRDIYLATWGIIVACTLQVTLGLVIWRKVERMHLTVFVITLIFGGLTLFFLALALVLIGAIALLTLNEGWGAFGEFFATVGFTGAYALSLVVSAVAGIAAHLILRRATPRS